MQNQLKPADRQALRSWDDYYETFLMSVVADDSESPVDQKKRIEKLEGDFEEWKKYYFPNYCFAPAAKFHKKASKRILQNPEWYECRAWSRELAKDVVTMMETMFQVLTGVKKSIILVSYSYDNAEKLITPFRINLEKNERIINDYGVQQQPGYWTKGDFITNAGASFLALGVGQSPRGTRNEAARPDKIIVSDIDTDQDVRNPEIIKNNWEWFEDALYPTRSVSKAFQILWLNNIIAKDCCMVRAMKKADHKQIVNLHDKNGVSTWPEKNSQEDIARIKSQISTRAFQKEYMNNPQTEGTIFKEMVWGKVPPLKSFRYLVAYGDPATSNREVGKNSFKSLFLIGEKGGLFYVLHGFCEQVNNAKFVQWYFDIRDRVKDRTQVNYWIENNSLQNPFFEQVFKPLFRQFGEVQGQIPIRPDERKKPDKFVRIEGNLEPLNRNGQLILNLAEKNNPHFITLEEQFKMINEKLTSPADGADTVEGGVFIINKKQTSDPSKISVVARASIKKF